MFLKEINSADSTIRILVTIALVVGLSGCASTATKNALAAVSASSVAYGQVIQLYETDIDINRKDCAGTFKDNQSFKPFCESLNDYEMARLATMNVGRFLLFGVIVPKSAQVQKGYIVEFNPSLVALGFMRIAAKEESETCHWVGPTYDNLNGRTGIALGFLAGMLIVPTVVVLANDDVLSGGVECNGWSYKTVWEKAKADANNR